MAAAVEVLAIDLCDSDDDDPPPVKASTVVLPPAASSQHGANVPLTQRAPQPPRIARSGTCCCLARGKAQCGSIARLVASESQAHGGERPLRCPLCKFCGSPTCGRSLLAGPVSAPPAVGAVSVGSTAAVRLPLSKPVPQSGALAGQRAVRATDLCSQAASEPLVSQGASASTPA